MSLGNAVRQREEMITEYQRMLTFETDERRIQDIKASILQIQEEIAELKKGKPLFGRPKPLTQTTTIIEPDPENPGEQKVTVINPRSEAETPSVVPSQAKDEVGQVDLKVVDSPVEQPKSKRLENNLRAKIQAAKAAKKGK